jgi:hypothetical protein
MDARAALRLSSRAVFLTAVFLCSATIAQAHDTQWAWSTSKAARVVSRDGRVQLPAADRAALAAELRELIPRFRTLEQFAWAVDDQHAAARIHNIRYRYSVALRKVEEGLAIGSAACSGSGSAGRQGLFRHFQCAVTSQELEIPTVELVYLTEDALPRVIESPPRRLGPYSARLLVHVTGKSALTYRRLG